MRLGRDESIPALLVHPEAEPTTAAPVVIWMHGRGVNKELDPGRYLRWMRAGIGACAIDLPGHGERFDAALHQPERTFEIVVQMEREIDAIVEALRDMDGFDMDRMGIGGMSGGGMAALIRLTREHHFACASVEATSGSWEHQRHRAMFRDVASEIFHAKNPIENLGGWKEVPFQAIHAVGDEWIAIEGQREFTRALKRQYGDPKRVELIEYENTGAPHEHAGFGRMSADAKNRQVEFFQRWLLA
jgi:dienelactone hydrolase